MDSVVRSQFWKHLLFSSLRRLVVKSSTPMHHALFRWSTTIPGLRMFTLNILVTMGRHGILSTVNYSDEALVIDTNSNPNMKSYRYKLGFQNANGDLFPAGDLLGNTVYSQEVKDLKNDGTFSIYTGDFEEGIYLVKVSSKNGSQTKKVVIKH